MSRAMTRRAWGKRVGASGLAALWAGCARKQSGDAGDGELKVFNWSDYIHEDAIDQFERQTGCTVIYDNYSSDSELETRLATAAGGYDVVFPSDRAMSALLAKDLLQPLEREKLSNFRHLDPQFLGAPVDPANRYSVPYFWGTLAVGVRSDKIGATTNDEAKSGAGQGGLEVLFDVKNRGRITMLDDMENVIAAALSHLGYPLNSVESHHLTAAQELLIEQRPLVQAYTSDAYRERLISGEAWAALGWSGDLLQADAELKAGKRGEGSGERGEVARVRVVIPRGGTMLWFDSMAIPRAATNVELALAFINHLLDPAIAVLNAQHVNYATPNLTAKALLPPQILADESIYPSQATLSRCSLLKNRGADIEKIEAVWRVVRQ
jgi:spermidine/putrescine-binding protein